MIVVTSIDVSAPDSAGKVSFSGAIPSSLEDDTSVVLRDVEKTDRTDEKGYPVFEGYVIKEDDAGKAINETLNDPNTEQTEILLCIHGHATEPHSWIAQARNAQVHSKKYILIPVVWPAESSGSGLISDYRNYKSNAVFAPVAGNAFIKACNFTKGHPVSIMGHSLGNAVILSFFEFGIPKLSNGEEMKFNSVFMVGADVWEETFNERVINGSRYHRDFNDGEVGLHLMNATERNIVIMHAKNDDALFLSSNIVNRGFFFSYRRLGQFGAAGQKGRLHQLAQAKLIDKDWKDYSHEIGKGGSPGFKRHNYHFSDRTVTEVYNNY